MPSCPTWQSVLTDDANARFGFGLRLFVDGIANVSQAKSTSLVVITVDDVRRIALDLAEVL